MEFSVHAEDVAVSGENEILTPGFVDNLGERSSILPDDLVRYTVSKPEGGLWIQSNLLKLIRDLSADQLGIPWFVREAYTVTEGANKFLRASIISIYLFQACREVGE